MTRRPASTTRRVELVELMRRPTPSTYLHEPQNRSQRRWLEKQLKKIAGKGPKP